MNLNPSEISDLIKSRIEKLELTATKALRDELETMAFERGLLILGAGPNSIRLCRDCQRLFPKEFHLNFSRIVAGH